MARYAATKERKEKKAQRQARRQAKAERVAGRQEARKERRAERVEKVQAMSPRERREFRKERRANRPERRAAKQEQRQARGAARPQRAGSSPQERREAKQPTPPQGAGSSPQYQPSPGPAPAEPESLPGIPGVPPGGLGDAPFDWSGNNPGMVNYPSQGPWGGSEGGFIEGGLGQLEEQYNPAPQQGAMDPGFNNQSQGMFQNLLPQYMEGFQNAYGGGQQMDQLNQFQQGIANNAPQMPQPQAQQSQGVAPAVYQRPAFKGLV